MLAALFLSGCFSSNSPRGDAPRGRIPGWEGPAKRAEESASQWPQHRRAEPGSGSRRSGSGGGGGSSSGGGSGEGLGARTLGLSVELESRCRGVRNGCLPAAELVTFCMRPLTALSFHPLHPHLSFSGPFSRLWEVPCRGICQMIKVRRVPVPPSTPPPRPRPYLCILFPNLIRGRFPEASWVHHPSPGTGSPRWVGLRGCLGGAHSLMEGRQSPSTEVA